MPSIESDLIGVGFGPANLALAIAMTETPAAQALKRCFIERQPEFSWHRDMLLDQGMLQISFLKDLVTLRNPQSRFTFVNYLHARGRLTSFINLKSNHPTRAEFNDYFRWAASAFSDVCRYGETVEVVEPLTRYKRITQFLVRSRTSEGAIIERVTRDLVVAAGGRPYFPQPFEDVASERIAHSSRYLSCERLACPPNAQARIAIVGGGQSAAEIFDDLTRRFPAARTTLILRDQALRPADDSPFVNEVFDPDFVDQFHALSPEARRSVLRAARNTNYSVVDLDLIERIYGLLYQQKVARRERHRILFNQGVEAIKAHDDRIDLAVRHRWSGDIMTESFDFVILATGYRYDVHKRLLAGLPDLFSFEVDRSYRLMTPPHYDARIYLQGTNEESHGLSDMLLSLLPLRSRDILDDLLAEQAPAAIASAG